MRRQAQLVLSALSLVLAALVAPGAGAHDGVKTAAGHAAEDAVTHTAAQERALDAHTRAVTAPDARAAAAAVAAAAQDVGEWGPVVAWPVVGVHVALLPNGKVLAYDSVGDHATETYPVHDHTRATVWDPATGTQTPVTVNTGFNIFCSGLAHMADGRMFMAGGNKDANLNGIVQTHLFDPGTNLWSLGPNMADERWYPTVTPLNNGEMLITSGRVDTPEVRTLAGGLRTLSTASLSLPLYPWMDVAPNGLAFYSGPDPNLRTLNTAGTGTWQARGQRDTINRDYGGHALFDVGKMLVAGGGPSTKDTRVVDFNGTSPQVSTTTPMAFGRRQHNLTVLADGTVLATGGNSSGAGLVDLNAGVYAAEQWNPATGQWRTLAAMQITRQYHSTALLLPDGRVLSSGGGICDTCDSVGYLAKNAEVFSPPYLFQADGTPAPRPAIDAAPTSTIYGAAMEIATGNPASIRKVALVRLGAVTHSDNMEQRYIPLTFTAGAASINAIAPANANIAPPGPYMLFIIDANGVPSVARMVSVQGNSPPAVALTQPTTGATFTAPATVNLAATASDADGSVTKVEFFNGAAKLGEDATAPYGFTWSSVAAGTYTLTARATDNLGATTTSAAATITVNVQGNSPPAVALTQPTTGATFTAPATVNLAATASDADGSVTKVEFFNGAAKLGEDATAPYSFTWSSVAAGTYTLTARATDNLGATTTSAAATITVNATQSTCPQGQYLAEYFANQTLSGQPVFTRCELAIANDWGSGGPGNGLGNDGFSVRWTGRFDFAAGIYSFMPRADDGVRLWVDGQQLVDAWVDQGATTYQANKTLAAGEHEVKLEYYEATGDAVAQLSWVNVPSAGTCPKGQYRGEFFANQTLAGAPAFERCESAIANNWGSGGPGNGLGNDGFSVRWTGQFDFAADVYSFTARADDGVRLWVDGQQVIDGWVDQGATTYQANKALAAGEHEVKLEYYENGGDAVAELGWVSANDNNPPSAPSALSATAVSASQINLAWTASTDNVAVTGYRVERCQGAGCANFVQVGTPTATTFNDTGRAAATSYSYRVRAIDAAGNLSGYSAIQSATTPLAPDLTPPTAPSGLTANAVSASQINLAWSASTDNVGVMGYRVERCQGVTCTTFVQVATPAGTTYNDTGLTTATTYRYRVRAADAAGNLSGYSAIQNATTPDTQAPTAPTGLSVTAVSPSQVNLAWTASTDNVAVTGYRVERCQGATCTTFAQVATPTGTTYNDTGLTTATTYRYRVRAADAAGNLSGYTAEQSATTPDTQAPTAPTGLTATAVSQSQIDLAWTASTDNVAVTGYRVERCQGAACTNFLQIAAPIGTTYSDGGLLVAATYRYRVRAADAAGNLSGYSAIQNAATTDTQPPTDPTGLTATAVFGTQIDLAWTGSTDNVAVANYRVERCQGATCTTFAQVATPTGTTYNDTGLTTATTYRYRVRAADAAGNLSGYTAEQSATTPDTQAPTAPTGLTATAVSQSQIDLAWTASTDNVAVTGYRVERCQGAACTNFLEIGTPSGSTFSDTGLAEATTYRYRVRGVDAAGNLSGYSAIQNAATTDTQPPTDPTGLTATAVSGTQIDLAWTGSTDNVAVANYRVERCQGAGCTIFVQVATPTGTTFSDTSLQNATFYSYRVRAADAAGNLSGYTAEQSATTPDTQAPTAPTGLTATAVSQSQIDLAWTASTDNVAVASYRVERCEGATCTNFVQVATPTAASYSDAGLLAATTYRYRARAADAVGNLSGYSTIQNAATPLAPDLTPPTAPSGLTASAVSASQINLAWSASIDNVAVTGYQVERCQGAGCTDFVQVATPSGIFYNDTGLTAATSYSYRVRAADGAGNLSGYTAEQSATTQVAGICSRSSAVWFTGMEHGVVSTAGGGIFSSLTGTPTADSTSPRSGTYSLRIADSSTSSTVRAIRSFTASNVVVTRLAVRLSSLPSVTSNLAYIDSGTDLIFRFNPATQRFQLVLGASIATSAIPVSAGTWFLIDLRYDLRANPHVGEWSVNGAPQPQVSRSATPATANGLGIGATGNASVYTANYDDLFVATQAAAYPLADSRIVPLVTNSAAPAGTANFRNNDGTVIGADSWQLLDEVPMASPADYIRQQANGGTSYVELGLQDVTITCIREVSAVLAYHAAGSSANNGKTSIFDGPTETPVFSGDMSQTALQYKSAVVTPAAASWDQTAVNGLVARVGYSTDSSPNPYWDSIVLEAAVD